MDSSKFQWVIIILQVMFLSIHLVSCEGPSTYPPEMKNIEDLEASLETSGIDVRRGGKTVTDLFRHGGQILFLNGGEVEVYEFSSKRECEILSETVNAEGIEVDGKFQFWDKKPAIWGSGRLMVVYWGYDGGVFLVLSGLMGDPLTYEAPAADEPYPPQVVAAIRYLADDLQVDPSQIQILDYNEVEWPDTCLGAPRSEEACLQMLTPGWRIMMKVSENVYEIRTDLLGEQFRQP
jgi:hypothetical protein